MSDPDSPTPSWMRRHGFAVLAALFVAVLAVLPWCRNRGYLRDFMDYGLVIAGNARIEAGERPYRDFTTPLQTGTFLLNGAAERVFGGTYLGMTWGGVLATILAGAGLTWVLARRWPSIPAALVALAVTVASFSQHTIIWYNAVGVGCLALVVWGGAVAPVLRREDRAWHLVVTAALFLGGINKLNYHLLALAILAAWALRTRWQGRASTGRTAVTLAWMVVAGLVAPVAFELAWTGAPLATWWHNVVALPLGARGNDLFRVASWQGLWHPVSPFYGPMALPCAGALCLALPAAALLAGWRRAAGERVLLGSAAIVAAVGGLALLTTDYDIDYLGVAAALVLTTGIWLGFGLPGRGWVFSAAMLAPAVLLAVTAGESAWRGQRSQFGHLDTPRALYRDAGAAGAEFAYFSGLRIPPKWADTLIFVKESLPPAGRSGLRPVFYGQGLEFLERPFPAAKHRGLPLWGFFGSVYGPKEIAQLVRLLGLDSTLLRFYFATTWTAMDPRVAKTLSVQYHLQRIEGMAGCWVRHPDAMPMADVEHSLYALARTFDGINLLNTIGGNIDPICFTINRGDTVVLPPTAGAGPIIGTTRGGLELLVRVRAHQLRGEAVLRRTGPGTAAVEAKFSVRDAGTGEVRWSGSIQLPAGETERTAAFEVAQDSEALLFLAEVPADSPTAVCAGFRQLRLLNTMSDGQPPPRLRHAAPADETPAPAPFRQLFPGGNWKMVGLVSRGARVVPEGLLLPPGGEFWFKAEPMLPDLRGELHRAPSNLPNNPVLRLVWRKGARIDVLVQEPLREANGTLDFHGWNAEQDGWFGLLVDPAPDTAPAVIRFKSVSP